MKIFFKKSTILFIILCTIFFTNIHFNSKQHWGILSHKLFAQTFNETIVQLNDTSKFIPPHVGTGDLDFKGHGPDVKVTARIYIANGSEIWCVYTMNAKETRRDHTEANGTRTECVYKHNKRIIGLLSKTYSEKSYRDTNHDDDILTLVPDELVNEFRCVGDTDGDDAGVRTSVIVRFNPVKILD